MHAEAAQEDEEDPFMFSRDPVPPPPPEAPNEEHLEFIHYQLDCLTEASGVVLYGLIMLGDRLQGGVLAAGSFSVPFSTKNSIIRTTI